MKKGKFVVIDGPDFSGKSTVVAKIKELLGDKVLTTREPGGAKGFAPITSKFRTIALESEYAKVASGTEVFCFMWGGRIAHCAELISPALEKGILALTDRFDSSTWAFNICAQKAPELREHFWLLRELILGTMEPDLYLYFDVSLEEVVKRKQKGRPEVENHFDAKGIEFQLDMRAGFAEFFQELEKRKGRLCHRVIDANQSEEKILADVLEILKGYIEA